jgi:hypothetical protein
MAGPLFDGLQPVRRRQRWVSALRGMLIGCVASSVAGMVIGAGRLFAGWTITPRDGALLLIAGPVLGFLCGLCLRRSWHDAATAVDTQYGFKDRILTALAFQQKPVQPAYSDLQMADALQHLSSVEASRVAPFRAPRSLPYAVGMIAVAAALLLWPTSRTTAEAGPLEPNPVFIAEAEKIEKDLDTIEELAKEEKNEQLSAMIEELRKKLDEMKEPGVELRDALAKLSEMQAALQAQSAQYNVGLVDVQLKAVGTGMSLAQSLESAGRALADGKFEKAAEELQKLEEPELDRKEARAVAEKLKKSSGEMGEAGLGSLSEAASDMAEGSEGNKAKFQKGARALAKEAKKHERLKKINDLLCKECDRLGECKACCQSNSTTKGKKPEKSTSPSQSWGMATSGNVEGDKTPMIGKRQMEQITGTAGDGPSETETSHTLEGSERAAREYKEIHKKYQQISESVLDSEPIPLGHRQTIRRYFELIRPQASDETAPSSNR